MFCPIIKKKCVEDCVFKSGTHCMIADYLLAHFLQAMEIRDASKEMAEYISQLASVLFGEIENFPPELRQQIEDILKRGKEE